ncbi:MAG TPA: threonine synthase [Bryobacteraceae bacterium]|nr:threonine synthase [Bryobacteraceae bacterium]
MGSPTQLVCSRCKSTQPANRLANTCQCGGPLLVEYDLREVASAWSKEALREATTNMWRYAPVLPAAPAEAITLQEGWTPLLRAERLGRQMGAARLWIKDEGRNPTDSFKARGLSVAITMAKKLGASKIAIPSAGNAAGASAAYAALAGLEAHIFMPQDVPQANFIECMAYGAHVSLIDGLISDCGRIVTERKQKEGWFEVSTLKEPYRIEGKKTMGYELAEQLNWNLPDAILYPCGGGVGLIGMWKAFAELEELGWISGKRPKMIAVQASGCAPIVQAFEAGKTVSDFWEGASTVASGLRVPKALGDALVLQAVRESEGTAIAVPDQEMIDSALELAKCEGLFAAPETGACVSATQRLLENGFLHPEDEIVIFSTGSGLKYQEVYATRFSRRALTEQNKLGGMITPR